MAGVVVHPVEDLFVLFVDLVGLFGDGAELAEELVGGCVIRKVLNTKLWETDKAHKRLTFILPGAHKVIGIVTIALPIRIPIGTLHLVEAHWLDSGSFRDHLLYLILILLELLDLIIEAIPPILQRKCCEVFRLFVIIFQEVIQPGVRLITFTFTVSSLVIPLSSELLILAVVVLNA